MNVPCTAYAGVAHCCWLCASGKGLIYSMEWDLWWRQEISKLEDGLGAWDGVQSHTDESCTAPETLQALLAQLSVPTMLLHSWAGRGRMHQLTCWILMVGESQPTVNYKPNGNSVSANHWRQGLLCLLLTLSKWCDSSCFFLSSGLKRTLLLVRGSPCWS